MKTYQIELRRVVFVNLTIELDEQQGPQNEARYF